jgi:hypothetical protein
LDEQSSRRPVARGDPPLRQGIGGCDPRECGAGEVAGKDSVLIVTGLLLLALCAALWAPDTPIGKSLRIALVDAPARALSRATPLTVIIGLIVFLTVVIFIFGAPELVALMGLSDLYFYLDITVISILMSTAVRSKSALAYSIRLVRGIAARKTPQWKRAGPRNRLSRPRRPKSPPSNDAGGAECEWALA